MNIKWSGENDTSGNNGVSFVYGSVFGALVFLLHFLCILIVKEVTLITVDV